MDNQKFELFLKLIGIIQASLVAHMVKNLPVI